MTTHPKIVFSGAAVVTVLCGAATLVPVTPGGAGTLGIRPGSRR